MKITTSALSRPLQAASLPQVEGWLTGFLLSEELLPCPCLVSWTEVPDAQIDAALAEPSGTFSRLHTT